MSCSSEFQSSTTCYVKSTLLCLSVLIAYLVPIENVDNRNSQSTFCINRPNLFNLSLQKRFQGPNIPAVFSEIYSNSTTSILEKRWRLHNSLEEGMPLIYIMALWFLVLSSHTVHLYHIILFDCSCIESKGLHHYAL